MNRRVFSAGNPVPPEPYSRAVVSGGQVFCSGTLGIDPATGKAAESVAAQTEQALINLADILSESGSSMRQLVKTTIYYVNTEDFATINEVYARHMPAPPPARSAVPCAILPGGLLFCIDAIATVALPGWSRRFRRSCRCFRGPPAWWRSRRGAGRSC
jgi:2-iminobutanoate/2-iminopropanoate deaminase